MVVGELNGNSNAIWGISPPAQVSTEITTSLDINVTQYNRSVCFNSLLHPQKRLITELQSNHTIKLKLDWTVKRPSNSPDIASECKAKREVNLEAYKGMAH